MPTSTSSARTSAQVGALFDWTSDPARYERQNSTPATSAPLRGLSIQVVIAEHLAVWRSWAEGHVGPNVKRSSAVAARERARGEAPRAPSNDRRRVRNIRPRVPGHGVRDRDQAALESGRGGGRCPDGVPESVRALRRHWRESGSCRLVEDGDDEPLPQPPVALPLALAVFQRTEAGRQRGRRRRWRARSRRRPAGARRSARATAAQRARDLDAAHEQARLEACAPRPAGSPAGADRALSLRGQELSRDRRAPRRDARQGQDRHPSRPRGAEAGAGIHHAAR